MKYTENGKIKDVDNQSLKRNLEFYRKSIENLSDMVNNSSSFS